MLWQSLKGLARNPMVLSIAAGILASGAGVAPPAALSRTGQLFAQASGALSLFVIGGSLVGLHIKGTLGTVAQISVGKLVLHPLAMLLKPMVWRRTQRIHAKPNSSTKPHASA